MDEALVISGPRRIGKTSLLYHGSAFASSIGKKPAFVDLQMFVGGTSAPELYYGLCQRLSETLGIGEPKPERFLRSPSNALRQFLFGLGEDSVLIIDEYDMLKGLGILGEFSSLLRSLSNDFFLKGQRSPPIIISSWMPPWRFIDNAMVSPFNVGRHVKLEGFDRREADELIRRGLPSLPVSDGDSLYQLVGGQPFLLQCALNWLAKDRSVTDLIEQAATESGPFVTYLDFLRYSIDDDVRQNLAGGNLSRLDAEHGQRLVEIGILKRNKGGFEWENDLYKVILAQ